MIKLIVDWVGRQFGSTHESPEEVRINGADKFDLTETEDASLSPSEMGIRFQQEEFGKLFNAIGHWESIEFFTAYGSPIESMEDLPVGADGGIDGVIRITTATRRGAKIVAGRIRNMILKQSY